MGMFAASVNPFSAAWNAIVTALNFLLQLFYSFTNNYGLAIIFLTVLVKLLLLPLTVKQTRSMLAMQKIQPEMKKIQEKYKDDRQKQSEELMRLYREHKVNPLSGCLPLIMQMPIFIALYMVLRKYVITPPIMLFGNVFFRMAGAAGNPQALQVSGELVRNTSFIGISNLSESAKEAGAGGLVLVILLMASTWYSQKQVTTDPRQKNMMLIMPLLMGFIGYSLPAGVVLYWVTTNILQIAQQAGLQYWDKKKAVGEEKVKVAGKAGAKEDAAGKQELKKGSPPTIKVERRVAEREGKDEARGARTARLLPGANKSGKDGKAREESGKRAKKLTAGTGAGKKCTVGLGSGEQSKKAGGGRGGKPPATTGAKDRRKPPPRKKQGEKDG